MNDFCTCLGGVITSDLQSGLIFAASKPTSSHSSNTPHEEDYFPRCSPQRSARFGALCLHRACTGYQVIAERREESQRDAQCGQRQRPARNPNRLALGRCQRAREWTPRHLRDQPAQRQRQLAFRRQPFACWFAEDLRNGHYHGQHRLRRQLFHPARPRRISRKARLQSQSLWTERIFAQSQRRNGQRLVLQRQHVPRLRSRHLRYQSESQSGPHANLQSGDHQTL